MKKLTASVCLVLALLGSAAAQCPATPPALRYPLWDWRFYNVNGGTLPQLIGYHFKDDTVAINIENGNRLGLTPDEIEIVLTAQNDWRKEIVAWSACAGRGAMISTQGSNLGPVTMRLNRNAGNADTILLRKEKLFEGMVDMYHMDVSYFWKMWAGKIVTFHWNYDNVWFGSYPPNCEFPCIPLGTSPSNGALYDADTKADLGIWRPSNGEWWVINSSTGANVVKQWGLPGDQPVPLDYDFDGTTDMAIWRPSTGEWWIRNSFTGAFRVVRFGSSTDTPVPADYDRDGCRFPHGEVSLSITNRRMEDPR